jgi:hypothetical protein
MVSVFFGPIVAILIIVFNDLRLNKLALAGYICTMAYLNKAFNIYRV